MLLSGETWEAVAQFVVDHFDDLGPFFVKFLIVVAALWFLLKGIQNVLDKATGLLKAYKDAGFPTTFSRERRKEINERRAFCKVLFADLAFLAKKENWNDQNFADLEADVEVEGRYYASALHRIFRRRTAGLRRVSSLIEAIESSSEQTLLVTGEPGSGKSVALRHLASDLAERGRTSSSGRALVPLYINLKELVVPEGRGIDGDCIQEFVLDNVRRGDSDTAAFIRDHWETYRDKGVWFFLFDSFDEIPAVLHAPSGSRVIADYTEAIHSFVVGMPACRSVLASREFKGPEQLPWHRLRILPLTEKRQQDLIRRSVLDEAGKELALTHVASANSILYENPMFLTLLCRHIKDTGGLPMNDLHLLSGHIRRLATRENEYIQRKYGVQPNDMIAAATHLAVLFAEAPDLGLAPTRDDVAKALAKRPDLRFDYDVLIPALVDVKIGRSDIEEARPGDRRFTFSHRRYQETLFADYLTRNPDHIAARQLLTDTRWREYAVTLLQSQTLEQLQNLMVEAQRLVGEFAERESTISLRDVAGLAVNVWRPDEVHLLRLLQEGLGRRPEMVPESLSSAVQELLEPRWDNGDILDRTAVIQLGGLLPKQLLTRYMLDSIATGSSELKVAAFRQSVFLGQMPEKLADFVREQLAQEILAARGRTAILQIRALGQRLPETIGAHHVLHRCVVLRALMGPGRLFNTAMRRIVGHRSSKAPSLDLRAHFRLRELMLTLFVLPYLGLGFVVFLVLEHFIGLSSHVYRNPFPVERLGVAIFLLLGYAGGAAAVLFAYRFRALGRPLHISLVLQRSAWPVVTRAGVMSVLTAMAGFIGSAIPGAIVALTLKKDVIGGSITSFWILLIGGIIVAGVLDALKARKQKRLFRDARADGSRGLAVALKAPSVDTLLMWIRADQTWIVADSIAARSLLRIGLWRNETSTYVMAGNEAPIVSTTWTPEQVRELYKTLLPALDETGWLIDVSAAEAETPNVLAYAPHESRRLATSSKNGHSLFA